MIPFQFPNPAPSLGQQRNEFDVSCEELVASLQPCVNWMSDTANTVDAAKTDAQNAAAAAQAAGAYKGAYNAGTTYQVGDSVLQAGVVFQANTVNTGITPVDGTNWRRVVQVPNPSTQVGKYLRSDGSPVPVYDDPLPIGAIMVSRTQPAGWLPADGALLSQSTYAALYALLGQPPGAGTAAYRVNVLPAGGVVFPSDPNGGAWSNDGRLLAVAHGSAPYLTVLRRTGAQFVAVPAPAATVGSQAVAWSPDDAYLAVANSAAPGVSIYKRTGQHLAKLPDPATLPGGNGADVAWSSDGVYLAVAHNATPFITIYKRSGDTFTNLSNPATLPGGSVSCVTFSPDTTYLAMGVAASPYVLIYKRSGDTFTKLADPGTLPTGAVAAPGGVAWGGAGNYLGVAHATSPYITIYSRSGDTFTKLSNPTTLPTGTGQGVAFSADERFMWVANDTAPYLSAYSRSGSTWTKVTDPADQPINSSSFLALGVGGTLLALGSSGGAGVSIYRALAYSTGSEFALPRLDADDSPLAQRATGAMGVYIRTT